MDATQTNIRRNEIIEADFGARKLIRFTCGCGLNTALCFLPDEHRSCLDCRADADRMANGWTPENSLS